MTTQPHAKGEPASTLDELAFFQDVEPVLNFEELLGKSFPEDESSEEFAAMLREWRYGHNDPQGKSPTPPHSC